MKYKGVFLVFLMFLSLSFTLGVSSDFDDISLIELEMVNQDPTTAVAGEIVEIKVGFENLGGESVSDLILEIEPDYPFKMVTDSIIDVGSVYGYQEDSNSKIESFKLLVDKEATAGTYELKLKYYEEGSNVVSIEYLDLEVVGRTSAQIITVNETQLVLGEITPIKFTINNVGTTALKNVNFEWEDPTGSILPIGSDNNRYISYLDIKDSEDFDFNVVTGSEVSAGVYSLNLKMTYENPITSEKEEISTITGIFVGGNADFDVILSDISTDDYSFSIMNVGTTPAYSISMKVLEENGWTVDGVDTIVLGNLDSGDYTSSSLSLLKSGINTGNLEIELYYTNSNGARQTIKKELILSGENNNINISDNVDMLDKKEEMINSGDFSGRPGMVNVNNESLISQYKYYLIGIVLVVGLFYGYNVYKKKKISKMMR